MSDDSTVVRAAPLRDQVYSALETLIVRGDLQPGERLVEAEVAARLGVSRNPVREAMTALARSGWIEMRPRSGAFVREQSSTDGADCFQIRCVLEAEASRQLAQLVADDPDAMRPGLERLGRLIAAVRPQIDHAEQSWLVEANAQFHRLLVELTNSGILIDFLAQLDKRVRWHFGAVAVARAHDSWREHALLLKTIERGDQAGAHDRMAQHIRNTAQAFEARCTPSKVVTAHS